MFPLFYSMNRYHANAVRQYAGQDKPKKAICNFMGDNCLNNGYAILTQDDNKTLIKLDLYNLPPGVHGFHIHEFADLRNKCMSLGSHYNPFNKRHGDLNAPENHLGDLGNIVVDAQGRCNATIIVNYLPLSGEHSVIGRSIVIHSGKDDLGHGGNEESKKSGYS